MFLDFFKEKGHACGTICTTCTNDDPSLLWINSGVATLKKYFDGRVVPKIHVLPMHKNQFVQMILKMLGKQHDTIHFLKCLETSQLVIISKKKQSIGLGNF